MIFDLDKEQGEWFPFFTSRVDAGTGEIIYDDPVSSARAQIRSWSPFFEERIAQRKKVVEHVFNPKTRSMERLSYFQELPPSEKKKEGEDAIDYAIVGLEGFKDKSGKVIACTRENKLKLMEIPVFDRYFARCLQLLASRGVEMEEEEKKT